MDLTSDKCPTCDASAGYETHELDTADHYERWYVCNSCGARTDDEELTDLRIKAQRAGGAA